MLAEKADRELGVTVGDGADDPAAVLDAIDRGLAGRPAGLVLDEFDRLLSHAADSPLQRLAVRLGARRWRNLTVIATVQRFYKNSAELEAWQLLACPADLSWRDGVTYFAPLLLQVQDGCREVPELTSPLVLPMAFREAVHRRLGLRPYFLGAARRRLESRLLMDDGYAVVPVEVIESIIDGFVDENQYLGQPLARRNRRGVAVGGAAP